LPPQLDMPFHALSFGGVRRTWRGFWLPKCFRPPCFFCPCTSC